MASAERETAVNAAKGFGNSDLESIPSNMIQVQLQRLIASSAFDASRRNRAFLRFIVAETLAARGDRIKVYTIQRDEAFDPQSDLIVRIEASRLRRSLERYSLIAGQEDPIRIEIPKWGYIRSFQRLHSVRDDCASPQGAYAPEPLEEEPRVLPAHREARTGRAGISGFLTFRRLPARIARVAGGVKHGGHRARPWPGLSRCRCGI
jgi:hypothetical protein